MFSCQIDSVLVLRSSCSFMETTFLKVDEIFDTCYTDNSAVKSGLEESSYSGTLLNGQDRLN